MALFLEERVTYNIYNLLSNTYIELNKRNVRTCLILGGRYGCVHVHSTFHSVWMWLSLKAEENTCRPSIVQFVGTNTCRGRRVGVENEDGRKQTPHH